MHLTSGTQRSWHATCTPSVPHYGLTVALSQRQRASPWRPATASTQRAPPSARSTFPHTPLDCVSGSRLIGTRTSPSDRVVRAALLHVPPASQPLPRPKHPPFFPVQPSKTLQRFPRKHNWPLTSPGRPPCTHRSPSKHSPATSASMHWQVILYATGLAPVQPPSCSTSRSSRPGRDLAPAATWDAISARNAAALARTCC